MAAYLEKAAVDLQLRGSVLFPSTDDGVKLLSKHQDRLCQYYYITIPEWEITQHFYDKRLTYQLAERQGVPTPVTVNPPDLAALDAIDLEFPVVLKPASNSYLKSITNQKAYRADNREHLTELYKRIAEIIDPGEILVQELIPGGAERLYSHFGYFKDGQLVSGYSARRPRQSPMDFGLTSTYVETVDLPELELLSTRLLAGTGFTGLAEIEFMDDKKHHRFDLIEVNPRMWGWHTLALSAGVNLPYLAYADAIHKPMKAGRYQANVKWIHMVSDLPVAVSEMLAGRLHPADYLRSLRGSRDAVISWRDPLPALVELLQVCYSTIRKKLFPRRLP